MKKQQRIKRCAILSIFLLISLVGCRWEKGKDTNYQAIAYVTVPASENWRWIGVDDGNKIVSEVDVGYITNIHFAFGMLKPYQFQEGSIGEPLKKGGVVAQEAYKDTRDGKYHYQVTLNGWIEEMRTVVDGDKYLRALVELKKQKPELKVSLSVGGWDSDGFCYMARTIEGRKEFIESCIQLIKDYRLDGIDIDWEYPTNGGWGAIASCASCIEDGRKLLVEMRETLDATFPQSHKLLSMASGASQSWIDEKTFKALDYMNVMCYDYNPGRGGSQASLAMAKLAMKAHLKDVGDTPENRRKINLGIPFYNEGGPYLVPFYKEWKGYVDASPDITKEKMEWVKKNGYGGAFYWAYGMDVYEQDVESPNDPRIKVLQKSVYETLNGEVEEGK